MNREYTGSAHESDRLPAALGDVIVTTPAKLKYVAWLALTIDEGSGATAMPRD